jgi:glycosyltransferase involved in cell wall biosynthesis
MSVRGRPVSTKRATAACIREEADQLSGRSIEVIIPVQNMAEQLPKVLGPLIDQLADGDVITVVNDASTDATEAVARSLGVNVVTLPNSLGPYHARQFSASRSTADTLLFIDARCRPLPGLLAAHRELQARPGVALSCTDVRTLSGPSLAARVSALKQPFSLRGMVGVRGRPDFYPTANLGIDRTVFARVGGFRAMRSGGDADICWRIQEQSLGTMAVDPRTLMDWEPRTTIRDLSSQWKRYGGSTAYLKWVYGQYSPAPYGPDESLLSKIKAEIQRRRSAPRSTLTEKAVGVAMAWVFQYGYLVATAKRGQFVMPEHYDLEGAESNP